MTILEYSDTYSEPYQRFEMEYFAKRVKSYKFFYFYPTNIMKAEKIIFYF